MNYEIIIKNKNILDRKNFLKKIEVGIVLMGWEVKSLRAKKATINNSYISFLKKELFLLNANFQPLNFSSYTEYNTIRNRKLLLKRDEIYKIFGLIKKNNFIILPLIFYWKSGWIKLQIGITKRVKKYDKRIIIKNREWKINKERIMKI